MKIIAGKGKAAQGWCQKSQRKKWNGKYEIMETKRQKELKSKWKVGIENFNKHKQKEDKTNECLK